MCEQKSQNSGLELFHEGFGSSGIALRLLLLLLWDSRFLVKHRLHSHLLGEGALELAIHHLDVLLIRVKLHHEGISLILELLLLWFGLVLVVVAVKQVVHEWVCEEFFILGIVVIILTDYNLLTKAHVHGSLLALAHHFTLIIVVFLVI